MSYCRARCPYGSSFWSFADLSNAPRCSRRRLKDSAAAAASALIIALLGVPGTIVAIIRGLARRRAGAAGLLFVVSADLANQVVERLIHIDAGLSGSLDEAASKVVGQVTTLCNFR